MREDLLGRVLLDDVIDPLLEFFRPSQERNVKCAKFFLGVLKDV